MGRKKKLSDEEFQTVMEQIMAVSDEPVPDMDFDIDCLTLDLDDSLAVAPPSPSEPLAADSKSFSMTGTRQICIRIPVRTLQEFKAQSVKKGSCYQSLMNRALKAAAEGFV